MVTLFDIFRKKEILQSDTGVSKAYLKNRQSVLDYTYQDMNLVLDTDDQVYIAVFDIPTGSGIIGFQTISLALVFGLNTHVYHSSGKTWVDLEKDERVMEAMQSTLISVHQVLDNMELVEDTNYYSSKAIRAYLKTRKGIYFKELSGDTRSEEFLKFLINHVMDAIGKQVTDFLM